MSSRSSAVKGREPRKVLTQHPKRLRWRRVAAGLSQEELAKKAGYTKQHIWVLERGDFGASAKCLAELAAVLDCKTTDLMPDEPNGAVA